VGPVGNIQAGDISGHCCRLDVFAVNGAFTGGTQARDYQTVTQHDLDQATTSLKMSLDQSIEAALHTQVHADETLLTPLACTTKATPDHQPGDEAARVQVQVTESCTGLAYNTHAYQNLLTQSVEQAARTQLGDGYQPQNDPLVTVLHSTTQEQDVMVEVRVTQSYGYQFTAEQQARMRALVAGKDKAGAITALLSVPGVQSVSLSIGNGGSVLPSDTSRIHLAFLVMLG
jgi:hypothetical protein